MLPDHSRQTCLQVILECLHKLPTADNNIFIDTWRANAASAKANFTNQNFGGDKVTLSDFQRIHLSLISLNVPSQADCSEECSKNASSR